MRMIRANRFARFALQRATKVYFLESFGCFGCLDGGAHRGCSGGKGQEPMSSQVRQPCLALELPTKTWPQIPWRADHRSTSFQKLSLGSGMVADLRDFMNMHGFGFPSFFFSRKSWILERFLLFSPRILGVRPRERILAVFVGFSFFFQNGKEKKIRVEGFS